MIAKIHICVGITIIIVNNDDATAIIYYIPHPKIPVIWLVKRAGMILTVLAKITVPGHSQSELGACYVLPVKITSTPRPCPHAVIMLKSQAAGIIWILR